MLQRAMVVKHNTSIEKVLNVFISATKNCRSNHAPAFYRARWLVKVTRHVYSTWRKNMTTWISGRTSGIDFVPWICYSSTFFMTTQIRYESIPIEINIFMYLPGIIDLLLCMHGMDYSDQSEPTLVISKLLSPFIARSSSAMVLSGSLSR